MHSLTPTPSIIITKPNPTICRPNQRSVTCKSSNSSSITEWNLYDLLGVDSSSDQSQIKLAYRALQKRCHPDIAGPVGHDMAIILNQAYALLSDPVLRGAYDKEQAKFSDFQGYTGKPIYSYWFGSESENRAVFVDELKCIGCLKCALLAEKTFAVESVYGRARVIGQWADPEHKIQEAIGSCPVDCISTVKKSDLAALEFLMSKKPRGSVRIGIGNTVGVRASDVFEDLEKFQARYGEALKKSSAGDAQASDAGESARAAAIQAIRRMSNWIYWQSHVPGNRAQILQNVKLIPEKSTEPDIQKLRNAAAARKDAGHSTRAAEGVSSGNIYEDEYWTPSTLVLPEAATMNHSSIKARTTKLMEQKRPGKKKFSNAERRRSSPYSWVVPVVTATAAAITVRLNMGEAASGELKEHIGGSLALEIINSSWSPVILAAVTWYLIGMNVMDIVEAFRNEARKIGK